MAFTIFVILMLILGLGVLYNIENLNKNPAFSPIVIPAIILYLFRNQFDEKFDFGIKLFQGIMIILTASTFYISFLFFKGGTEAKKRSKKTGKYIAGSIFTITSILLSIGIIFPSTTGYVIDLGESYLSAYFGLGEDLADSNETEAFVQPDNADDSLQASDASRTDTADSSPGYDTEIDDSEWSSNPFDDGSGEVYSEPEPEVEDPDIVYVDGYYRDDGTYVDDYIRTAPDDSIYNNFSYEYGDEYDSLYYDSYDYEDSSSYDTYDYNDSSYYDTDDSDYYDSYDSSYDYDGY